MATNDSTCANSVIPSNTALDDAIAESDVLVNNGPDTNDRGEKPISSKVFKTQDAISFNRQTYQFSRSVAWQYL